jgi:hypothetical protein
MSFQSPTTNRQALTKQDEDLTHIGSWANIDKNAGNDARFSSKDPLIPSHNAIQSRPHHTNSNHVFGSANELPKQPNTRNSVSLNHSINGTSSYLTATTLSNCKDGLPQLGVWTRDFQRHEETAYRLARS